MSKPTKPTCPKCGSDFVRETFGSILCHVCHCCWAKPENAPQPPTRPMQPDASARPATRRVRTSTAACDIDNAFTQLIGLALNTCHGAIYTEAQAASARVTAWLVQVEAEQRQLRAALLACQGMAAVTDYGDMDAVHAARKLALDAIAEAPAEGQGRPR